MIVKLTQNQETIIDDAEFAKLNVIDENITRSEKVVRIRYKDVNGLLVSPEYLAVKDLVRVFIRPQTFEVEVRTGDEVLFCSINQGNLQNCKKMAKRTLIEMGVNFQPEVRPRIDSDFYALAGKKLITDDLGPNASLTYKDDLFEEDDVQ